MAKLPNAWETNYWRATSARHSGKNPIPLIVPCHRVLAAGGKTGGFSAPGGVVSKLRLLTIEGAQPNGPTLFDRLPLAAKRRRRS
jgi:methylated-DNA-[protein]-cysteine S-methyltransferase